MRTCVLLWSYFSTQDAQSRSLVLSGPFLRIYPDRPAITRLGTESDDGLLHVMFIFFVPRTGARDAKMSRSMAGMVESHSQSGKSFQLHIEANISSKQYDFANLAAASHSSPGPISTFLIS